MIWVLKAFHSLLLSVSPQNVNSTGAVCDQKTSKFFVSHQEESMARPVGIIGVN
jgi:hypothetical protein